MPQSNPYLEALARLQAHRAPRPTSGTGVAPSRPLDDEPPDLDFSTLFNQPASAPSEPSGLGALWSFLNRPLVDLSEAGRNFATRVTDPSHGPVHPLAAFGGGAVEGLSNLVSGFTSPLGVASLAAGGGTYGAAKAGLPALARALRTADVGIAGLGAGAGVHTAATGETTGERVGGVGQALMSALGGTLAARAPISAATAPAGGVPLVPGRTSALERFSRLPERPLQPGTVEDLPWSRQTMPRHQPAPPPRAGEMVGQSERWRGPDLLRSNPRALPPPAPEGTITTGAPQQRPPLPDRVPPYSYLQSRQMSPELDALRRELGLPEPQVFRSGAPEFTNPTGPPEPLEVYPRVPRTSSPGVPPSESLAMAGARQPSMFEALDPTTSRLNASGESAASMEALNRQRSMQGKGESFVVYDRTGQRRPLFGPDAVDYVAREGETYGIEGPQGFRVLDDLGGRAPRAGLPPTSAATTTTVPEIAPGLATLGEAEGATGDTGIDTLLRTLRGPEAPTPATSGIPDLYRGAPRGASGKPKIPAETVREWQHRRTTEEGFTTPLEEYGLEQARRLDAPRPRDLPNAQRKFLQEIDERYANNLASERGAASPELLASLVRTVGGAGAGSVAGSALDENKMRGATTGALVGGALANPRQAAKLLSKLQGTRYFSMLSSPATHAKNVLGAAGAVGNEALERTFAGKPKDALQILREVFSRQTLDDAASEFKSPTFADARWGDLQGVLGVPGRAMASVDAATTKALQRTGLGEDAAREITFTSKPRSKTGQWIVSRPNLMSLPIPFPKVATNIIEQGIRRTPILGSLAEELTGGELSTSVPKQLMGAAAMYGGYKAGEENPYLQALLAPLAVPFALGAGAGKATEAGKTGFDVTKAMGEAFLRSTPLPSNMLAYDPASYLAQLVPNLGRDVSRLVATDPSTLDTSGTPAGKALAKIPWLNALLLDRKSKGRAARAPSARRAPRK